MQQQVEPIFLRYGGAEKLTSEMNQTELEEVANSILRRAKEKAFSKGRPIIFSEGEKLFAEWGDGHVQEVKTEE